MRLHLAVADLDANEPDIKFYRLTINTWSANSKTTLQTGFYDAKTVRDLFGEVKPSTSGAAEREATGRQQFVLRGKAGGWRPVPPSELFTIIYGADAKALAAEIKAQASSAEAGEQLGSLLAAAAGRETYLEAISAEQISEAERRHAKALALAVRKAKADLEAANSKPAQGNVQNPPAVDPIELDKALLALAQEAARQLGSPTQFRTDSLTNGWADAERLLEIIRTNTGK